MSELEPIYYMRDNHTFKRLSESVLPALNEMKKCWDDGYTSGLLSTSRPGAPKGLHATGKSWRQFSLEARTWYAELQESQR